MALGLLLSALIVSPAWAQLTLERPVEGAPGRPVEVTAVLDPGVDVAQAELLYRSAATPEIQALLMELVAPRRYRVAVPGEHVVPPGVELVIRLRDRQGRARLVFQEEPERPFVVAVAGPGAPPAAPEPLPVAELVPAPGDAVVGRRPTLIVRLAPEAPPLAPGQVMVTLDGVDMTPQLEIVGREVRLRPASRLAPGPHQAVVRLLGAEGQRHAPLFWPFTVRDHVGVQEGSLGVALSGTYEYATNKLVAADPRWKAHANLRVEGRLAEGGFEGSLGGDLRYIDQHPGEPPGVKRDVELAGHLFRLLYGRGGFRGRFELGEVAVSETMLTTGPSFARRGGQVVARAQGTELHLFSTSAVPLFGFDDFTGLEESDRRVQGVSLAHELLGERLKLKLTALDGRNAPRERLGAGALGLVPGQPSQQALQAYNVGSAQGGFDARTYSVLVSSRLFDGHLRAEAEGAWGRRLLFSGGEFGSEPDARGRQGDDAWRARVEGDLAGVRAGAEYQRVGLDFLSPANPTLVSDREEVALDLSTAVWLTSWQLRASRGHDNVRDTGSVPQTTERRLMPSVTLAAPHAPSLTLTYLRSDQTTDRPLEMQPRSLLTQGGSAALSFAAPGWFASLVPGYYVQDARAPGRETDTRTLTLMLGITPARWLSVTPSYTFTRTRDVSTQTIADTHAPTLTARVEVLPGLLALDTQSSYVATADNKGTVDTGTFASLARATVSLKRWFPGGMAPAVGVRVNYNRTVDGIVATNTREDFGVSLIFDVYAPLGLLPRPALDWQPGGPAPGGPTAVGARF